MTVTTKTPATEGERVCAPNSPAGMAEVACNLILSPYLAFWNALVVGACTAAIPAEPAGPGQGSEDPGPPPSCTQPGID